MLDYILFALSAFVCCMYVVLKNINNLDILAAAILTCFLSVQTGQNLNRVRAETELEDFKQSANDWAQESLKWQKRAQAYEMHLKQSFTRAEIDSIFLAHPPK